MSHVKCVEVSTRQWQEITSQDCFLFIAKNVDPPDQLHPSEPVITPKQEQTEEHYENKMGLNFENCVILALVLQIVLALVGMRQIYKTSSLMMIIFTLLSSSSRYTVQVR